MLGRSAKLTVVGDLSFDLMSMLSIQITAGLAQKSLSSHGMPLLSKNKMAVGASRSSSRLQPGCLNRRVGRGSSGTIKAHTSSSSSGLAIALARRGQKVGQPRLVHFVRASKRNEPETIGASFPPTIRERAHRGQGTPERFTESD